jgi:putative transposase
MSNTTPLESGKYYHIYNRGNNKEQIFRDNSDYCYFLHLLTKHIIPATQVYCYCLMNNHFHLIIKIRTDQVQKGMDGRDINVSQCFSNCFNAYAKSFNKKYNRTGKLFAERFKRKPVDSDAYFTELIYYIHANPQRHEIIDDFRNYPYSSYNEIVSTGPTNLSKNEILDWFGGKHFFEQYHAERVQYLLNYEAFER